MICCLGGKNRLEREKIRKLRSIRVHIPEGRLSMRKDSVLQPTETYLLTLVQRQSRIVIEKRIYVCV